ncbi:MAG: protein-disulfide reductase DsbD domain-containing protein [Planctomycetota bacterium]
MMNSLLSTFAVLGACALTSPLAAQVKLPKPQDRAPAKAEDLASVKVMADHDGIAPGETIHLAISFDIAPKWHIYWKNPGSGGMPTMVTVDGPDDLVIGEAMFPRPIEFQDADGMSFGYEDGTTLFVPVTAPTEFTAETIVLQVNVDYLVCKQICLMGNHTATVTLPVKRSGVRPIELPSKMQTARNQLPVSIEDTDRASASLQRDVLTIRVASDGATTATLFPDERPGVTFGEPRIRSEGDRTLVIEVPITLQPQNALGEDLVIAGLVAVGDSLDQPSYAFDMPVDSR